MGLLDFGKLTKLTITEYTEDKKNQKINPGKNSMTVMFNPQSYSEKFSLDYKTNDAANTGPQVVDSVKPLPQDFNLKLIIDGTGVSDYHVPYLPGIYNEDEYVKNEIDKFLALTWELNEIGEPKLLELKWGNLLFYGRLKTVNINYVLFNREGMPLRAELDVSFIAYDEGKYKKSVTLPMGTTPGAVRAASTVSAAGAADSKDKIANGIIIRVS